MEKEAIIEKYKVLKELVKLQESLYVELLTDFLKENSDIKDTKPYEEFIAKLQNSDNQFLKVLVKNLCPLAKSLNVESLEDLFKADKKSLIEQLQKNIQLFSNHLKYSKNPKD
ncbi:MAG: hypothetical protein MUF50_03390 [Planctomycetes bacterium]|jgi:hypothetical protein|nr:hypothetical protein [Planctomycetota bacterium]